MTTVKHKHLIGLAFSLIAGVALGFSLAWTSFRTVILIDYDSGNIKRHAKLGPFIIREDIGFGWGFPGIEEFGLIPIGNQQNALTGSNNWRIAFVFHQNSKTSASFEGGNVVNLIRRLQIAAQIHKELSIGTAKERFLSALAKQGLDAAAEVVRDSERSEKDIRP